MQAALGHLEGGGGGHGPRRSLRKPQKLGMRVRQRVIM